MTVPYIEKSIKEIYTKLSIDHAIEFMGVFLSIILAFWLQNWSEDIKDREKETIYMENLYSDLVTDYNGLERRISEYDRKLKSVEKIMQIISVRGKKNTDSILYLVNKELTYNHFYTPHNHTYESLKYNGDLQLITNSNFKILLSELDVSYRTTITHGNFFLDYTNSPMWSGFLLDHLDYMKKADLDDKFFNIHFYNRLTRLYRFIENYYYAMQGTLKKIDQVRLEAEQEMGNLGIDYKKPEIEENIFLKVTN